MSDDCKEAPLRTCWIGALKAFGLRSTNAQVPCCAQTAVAGNGFLAPQDLQLLQDLAAAAFPLFAKCQVNFCEVRGIGSLGLRDMCALLAMDISVADLDRVFAEADKDRDCLLNDGEFREAAQTTAFFSNLVKTMTAASGFQVGRHYDYLRSTRENYDETCDQEHTCTLEANESFRQELASARQAMPSGRYAKARAAWQDAVVARSLPLAPAQHRPWAVLTMGPDGAFPGDALEWLAKHGFLPLSQVVAISAADFAQQLPELPLYLRQGRQEHVQEEAQFMESLALEVAASRRQHIWASFEVSSARRVAEIITRLRVRHPAYHVAVFDVRADIEVIRQRHRAVLRQTGRGKQPHAELPDSEAAADLSALADLLARVDNSEEPVLLSLETADRSGCWHALARRIEGAVPSSMEVRAFPFALPPLRLERVDINERVLERLPEPLHLGPRRLRVDMQYFGSAMCAFQTSKLISAALEISHVDLVLAARSSTAPGGGQIEKREDAHFAWLHGLPGKITRSWLQQHDINPDNLLTRLLRHGCLLHFDAQDMPSCMHVWTDAPSEVYLQFSKMFRLCDSDMMELQLQWTPCASCREELRGAVAECWLAPGSRLSNQPFPGGGFAFKLDAAASAVAGCEAVAFAIL